MPTESKSETPRTYNNTYGSKGVAGAGYVSADFARQLEKELNEAKREIEACYKLVNEAGVSHAIGAENQGVRTLVAWIINERNAIAKELADVKAAISKFGYQDGTLVSMCERFKTYCDNQTRHLKEDTAAAVTAVTQLAKEKR